MPFNLPSATYQAWILALHMMRESIQNGLRPGCRSKYYIYCMVNLSTSRAQWQYVQEGIDLQNLRKKTELLEMFRDLLICNFKSVVSFLQGGRICKNALKIFLEFVERPTTHKIKSENLIGFLHLRENTFAPLASSWRLLFSRVQHAVERPKQSTATLWFSLFNWA